MKSMSFMNDMGFCEQTNYRAASLHRAWCWRNWVFFLFFILRMSFSSVPILSLNLRRFFIHVSLGAYTLSLLTYACFGFTFLFISYLWTLLRPELGFGAAFLCFLLISVSHFGASCFVVARHLFLLSDVKVGWLFFTMFDLYVFLVFHDLKGGVISACGG